MAGREPWAGGNPCDSHEEKELKQRRGIDRVKQSKGVEEHEEEVFKGLSK